MTIDDQGRERYIGKWNRNDKGRERETRKWNEKVNLNKEGNKEKMKKSQQR